ncbi:hypothetical protein AX16_001074 [Volvariella volvacea WC 439]|nr:hypothetical protein AX16_001074 [Volvariella volvacea WC 439]
MKEALSPDTISSPGPRFRHSHHEAPSYDFSSPPTSMPVPTHVPMPMPDFWQATYYTRKHSGSFIWRLESIVFTTLAITTFGTKTLQPVWDVVRPGNEEGFIGYKNRLQNQTQNMNIVSGLLLATNAVFLTTVPPRPDLSDYTTIAPYVCMLASFAMTMGSLLAGSSLLFVMNHSTAEWFREVSEFRYIPHWSARINAPSWRSWDGGS